MNHTTAGYRAEVVGAALFIIVAIVLWALYVTFKNPCADVVSFARNPDNKEVKSFPTPCDLPFGWEKVSPDELK